ncbi:hypothetical protein [Actinocorallia sp. A-T 12471]|uniref:hypothetical protein n=1 Tax=Actinocorallia sp. A-T 12471 TaxID=3089813 RepID=UPI0029D17852|nr:hypothetical protein [Actinocorallia sp. A-T 12471]MDX6742278.1 hypothetical protein [Actinocorallia sp. A-T 12471]
MRREEAAALVVELLDRLERDGGEYPVSLVQEIHVYGPFAAGAREMDNVDVHVEFEHSERWLEETMERFFQARDAYAPFRKALRGARRRIKVNLDRRPDVPMRVLWRRGEDFAVARERLRAIPEAQRELTLPELDGLERWISGNTPELLTRAVSEGALGVGTGGGVEYLEVVRPVGAGPLEALRVTLREPGYFKEGAVWMWWQ